MREDKNQHWDMGGETHRSCMPCECFICGGMFFAEEPFQVLTPSGEILYICKECAEELRCDKCGAVLGEDIIVEECSECGNISFLCRDCMPGYVRIRERKGRWAWMRELLSHLVFWRRGVQITRTRTEKGEIIGIDPGRGRGVALNIYLNFPSGRNEEEGD